MNGKKLIVLIGVIVVLLIIRFVVLKKLPLNLTNNVPQNENITETKGSSIPKDEGNIEDKVGYTSAPERNAIVETEGGTKLISNELLITVKENVTKKEVEEAIKEYSGKIVGYLSIVNQYQVRFEGQGEAFINNLKTEIEKNDIVEAIYFNIALDLTIGV